MNRTLLLTLAAISLAVALPATATACVGPDCIPPPPEEVCSALLRACVDTSPPIADPQLPNPFEPCTCDPVD